MNGIVTELPNRATTRFATVGGGANNLAGSPNSTVGGGFGNTASGPSATVSGGHGNQARNTNAFVGGGTENDSSGQESTIGGGFRNTATNLGSTVGGGSNNNATGPEAVVAGGAGNDATGQRSTVGGGLNNGANAQSSTVAGGRDNIANGIEATVGGGARNTASQLGATVPGGEGNLAGGRFSLAAGRRARVRTTGPNGDEGTFIWADSTDADFTSTGPNQFLIRAGGGVGIGTNSPTRGFVEISGFRSFNLRDYGWLNVTGVTGAVVDTDQVNDFSLYASHRIAAIEFNAHSDARTKRILGKTDNDRDLKTLLDIEVTDYAMIDTVACGERRHKKVIGQQVGEVFPQAVSTVQDVVPDIYAMAEVRDGWVLLATDLKVGEQVRLITQLESSMHEVLEVRDDAFRVDLAKSESVFVYGREVNDFHNVDYEAISMLNVSATQALYGLVEAQQTEIDQLRQTNEALAARLSRLEEAMARLSNGVSR